MNLADVKRKALILMREWTDGDGAVIADADNLDYLRSIDDLANIAQNEIAQKQKIRKTFTIDPTIPTGTYGPYTTFALPTDWLAHDKVMRLTTTSIAENPVRQYIFPDKDSIAILTTIISTYTWVLHYYAMPTQIVPNVLDPTANDAYVFEVDLETQELIPYYIAAQLLLEPGTEGIAITKLNEYHARLDQLSTKIEPNIDTIIDTVGW